MVDYPTYAEVRRVKGGFGKGLYDLTKANSEAIGNLDTVDLAAVEQAVATLEGTDIPALEAAVALIPSTLFIQAYLPADEAADTWVKTLGVVPEAAVPTAVLLMPDADIGQATNYMTLTVKEMNVAANPGTAKQALGTQDLNSTHTIESDTGVDIIAAEPVEMVAGNKLVVEKTKTGDGQAWPGGLVIVQYTIPEPE